MSGGQPTADRLVVRGLTDVRSVRDILWPAFLRDDGASAEIDYRQEVDMARLLTDVSAAEAGGRPDLLIVADPIVFARAGIVRVIDGLESGPVPVAWTDPAGRWWPIYVQPIVVVYNALHARPPAGWSDLAGPAWDGRIVFEAASRMLTTGPAFAELRSAFGEASWTSWLADLAARRPRQVADNERAVLEVATGSMWGGLANWNVARRVRSGSPVRHVFLDPTPCIPGFGVAVAGGSNPDLADRFGRWLAAEPGQAAYAKTGRIPASAPAGSALDTSTVIPRGITPLLGTADWVGDPDPWVATFSAALPMVGPASAGKLGGR